jgi:hypothetical protein
MLPGAMDDGLDRQEWMRQQPSYGPNWDAAIAFGIDVTLIEQALARTVAERFRESLEMTRFATEIDLARERLYGSAE